MFTALVEGPVSQWRDKVWAKRAFNLSYPNCQNEYPADFEAGFIAGYCDACDGGNGVPPALPPKAYWSDRYKTEQGSGMAEASFAGYPAGAQAADQDGSSQFHEISISNQWAETLNQNQMINQGAVIGSGLVGATEPIDYPTSMPAETTFQDSYSESPWPMNVPTVQPTNDYPPIRTPTEVVPPTYSPAGTGWSSPTNSASPMPLGTSSSSFYYSQGNQ